MLSRSTINRLLVLVLGCLCLIPMNSVKAEKYPILVYHDPVTVYYFWNSTRLADSLAHRYFSEMQDFGINIIIGQTVAHTAALCDTFDIELTPYNWPVDTLAPNRMNPIADVKPYYLQTFVSNGRWYQMEAEVNQDLPRGYAFSDLASDSTTGENILTSNGYRKASPGVDSPGYLFRKIDTLYKEWNATGADVNDHGGYVIDSFLYAMDSLRYAKSCFIMRYDSVLDDTSVIAQIRVINPGGYWPHRLVTIRNNEWFVDDSGVAHYQGDVVHYPRFDIGVNTWVDSVGYIDGMGDTIGMGLVYNSIRDIRPSDFNGIGEWDTLYAIYPWYLNRHLVWWYGDSRLDIDRFFLTNETSEVFRARLDNATQKYAMRDRIDAMYDSLGIGSSLTDIIDYWYVRDEPWNGTYYPMQQARELLTSSQRNPDIELRAARNPDDKPGQLDHCLEVLSGIAYCPETLAEVESFFGDCDVEHYSYADTLDVDNPQYWWNKSIADIAMQRQKAENAEVKFFPIVYPASAYNHDTERQIRIASRREAFGNDIKCQAYLCVAYGADGIGYYPYISYGPTPDAPPKSIWQDMFISGSQDKSASCPEFPDDSVTWDNRSFVIANISTGIYSKVNDESNGYKWDAGKQVHGVLNRLADILNGRTFVGAGPWYNLGSSNTAFTHISSDKFDDDEAFIQVGEFTGADNVEYYMLINRRTWPDSSTAPNHKSDSQRVYFATNLPITGDKLAIDMVTGDTIPLVDSMGKATGSIVLPPGEAAILKFDTTKTWFWKGDFAGVKTFSENAVRYISGDVTINPAETLTVKPGNEFRILKNMDSCAAGINTSKAELIVKGHLRAVGSSNNRIQFRDTSDATAAWYGIRIVDTGSADIRYADIKNAYIGYKNTSSEATNADTLQYITFSKCKPNAVVLANSDMVVSHVSVTSDLTTASGIHIDSAFHDTITNCSFNSVKYAVEIDHSLPKLSKMTFNDCKYGIWVDGYNVGDTVRIDSCLFDHWEIPTADLVIGQDYSYVRLDSCRFNYINGPYGILNMYSHSKVRVRRSWFKYGDENNTSMVYSNGYNTDLGCVDMGYNVLYNIGGLNAYYIYNSNAVDTTYAKHCCFDAQDPPSSQFFHGPVSIQDYVYENCGEMQKAVVRPDSATVSGELSFTALQNHPNPFNPSTTIAYAIPVACKVTIKVYNVLGQVVNTLVEENKGPGEYSVIWEGTDADGRPVASGMYFYQMVAGDYISSKKMVMMK